MPKEIRDSAILNPAGGTPTDITEVRSQESLLKAGALQNAIFNSANFSSIATDAKGVIQIFNVGAERMLGYTAADVMNKISPADISDPQEVIARAKALSAELGTPITPGFEALVFKASRGIEDIYELTYIRKDGSRFPAVVSVTALRDDEGAIIGYLLIGTDNTARKQAEAALLKAGALQNAIFNSANFSSIATDAKGVIQIFNVGAERMLGYAAADVMNKITPADISDPQEVIARAKSLSVELGTPITPGFEALVFKASRGIEDIYELTYIRKDGSRFPAVVSVTALRDDQGAIIGYLLIGTDNTARKQAEAQLRQSQAEAQLRQSQKMEAIGQLAGGVAHDFNNLLTGILGNIALMRSSLPPADPLLENLNAAETSARQAADLTKGLLTFSRSAMVLPVPMNITAALDATLALLKQSLPATMEIVRDYEQTTWNVLLDQSQLTQIMLNLAVNARDAMKGKGTLTIRTRNEVVGEEYLQANPLARTGDFVHLSVTDTGPGMSSEVMQHLFEPFYTTKPVGSGTGLGLSIVYGAVKQAGGWITAVSTEGVGTTFDIYLPRCLEEPTESFAPSPLSVDVRGGTVLVVEDEPVVRAVAQALLSRSGYTVLTAPDGASALSVLQDHPLGIGLILLDMTMPGMTSGEAVQAIRALDPTIPILLTSGYTSNGAVKRMLAEGTVQGFLPKPYELHELLSTINQLLQRT
jgi:signal transduction histidine kinase